MKRKNRGYVGYYKGKQLRSTLEFIYAYYLDYKNINWEYEIKTFNLGDRNYKPDFFLPDNNGDVKEIVEIKSDVNDEDGLEKLNLFKQKYSIPIKILGTKELVNIYQKEMPISFNKARLMWRNIYGQL